MEEKIEEWREGGGRDEGEMKENESNKALKTKTT